MIAEIMCVYSFRRYSDSDESAATSSGRVFQSARSADSNDRSPTVTRCDGPAGSEKKLGVHSSQLESFVVVINHRRIDVRKHFSEHIIRVWNSLPPSIVSFKSLLSVRNSSSNVNLGNIYQILIVVFLFCFYYRCI